MEGRAGNGDMRSDSGYSPPVVALAHRQEELDSISIKFDHFLTSLSIIGSSICFRH